MIIPKNRDYNFNFLDYNFSFYRMIDMHSNHDNMHKIETLYALICINNHIITCIDCMLSSVSLDKL